MKQFKKNGFWANYNPSSIESISNAVQYCGGSKKDIQKLVDKAKKEGYRVQ